MSEQQREADYLLEMKDHAPRYILHQAADGATVRFEPSTGKAWILTLYERGNYKYGAKQIEERQYFWTPILEDDPAPEA